MFQHLVDFSLKNKAAVLALTAIVAVWGWLSFRDLTVEAFPDPTETQVQVITLYPGQPTEEVERQLGLPLERALNGISAAVTAPEPVSVRALLRDPHLRRRRPTGSGRDSKSWSGSATWTCPTASSRSSGRYATPIGEVYRYTLGARAETR